MVLGKCLSSVSEFTSVVLLFIAYDVIHFESSFFFTGLSHDIVVIIWIHGHLLGENRS